MPIPLTSLKKPLLLAKCHRKESPNKLLKVAILSVQLTQLFHLGQEKWLELVISSERVSSKRETRPKPLQSSTELEKCSVVALSEK